MALCGLGENMKKSEFPTNPKIGSIDFFENVANFCAVYCLKKIDFYFKSFIKYL